MTLLSRRVRRRPPAGSPPGGRRYTEGVPRLLLGFAVLALAMHAEDPAAARVRAKLDLISEEVARPGSTIVFPPADVNAWVREELAESVPMGVRESLVTFGTDTIELSAIVDIRKIAESDGKQINAMVGKLLEGERPVKMSLRTESAGGRLTVFLTAVEISGLPVTGAALDLLVRAVLLPLYPDADAKINEAFDLKYRMERVSVQPSGIHVLIKK